MSPFRHPQSVICNLLLLSLPAAAAPLPGYHPSPYFSEQILDQTLPNNVRFHADASGDFDPAKPTELIIYLLPNGNTIEQTLGCQLVPGLDWHYDIQHIAAQVRLLRHLDSAQNLVLACLEAPGKTWPKFRADHPKDNPDLIRSLVQSSIDSAIPNVPNPSISLVSHSGGGSFLIGFLNSPQPIPSTIDRIVFLDSNYSYSDDEHHGDKLLAWLRSSPVHHLVVFAYDDRNVTFNGKKIVSDTGGTFRATGRMIDRFSKEQSPVHDTVGPFDHFTFLNGQAQFFRHSNPELKILHTAMIGDMNAFLHAMTLGTSLENKYGILGGPRAYMQYVQPAPATQPAITNPNSEIHLPARSPAALTGSAIHPRIKDLPTTEREIFITGEILAGNIPDFLRKLVPITISATAQDGSAHTATYYVTSDVLSVGSDADFFRMPLTPMTVEKIAAALDCSMITRKISDDIYIRAAFKLDPRPLTEKRDFAETFYQHNQIIQDQLKLQAEYHPGSLVAGIKKDVVLTNRLKEKPHKVAIYGWHKLDGKAIQPLYVGHVDWYVDYSHGIRLISNHLLVDGKPTTVQAVLTDPVLSILLSDEGPIIPPHYPTTQPVQ